MSLPPGNGIAYATAVETNDGTVVESVTDAAIDEFIEAIPEARRDRARSLHRLIRKLFPEVQVSFEHDMATYRLGEHCLAWGNQKTHLLLHARSRARIAVFRARHPEIPATLDCLQFRDRDGFPLEDLAVVVRHSLAPPPAVLDRERALAPAAAVSKRGAVGKAKATPKRAASRTRAPGRAK
jgi:uncharacterized protein YdhG (YjbR/CyaY superfamily)